MASAGVPLDSLKSRLARCTHLHATTCAFATKPPWPLRPGTAQICTQTRRGELTRANACAEQPHRRPRHRIWPNVQFGADAREGRVSHATRGLHRRAGHLRHSTRRRHMRRLFTGWLTALPDDASPSSDRPTSASGGASPASAASPPDWSARRRDARPGLIARTGTCASPTSGIPLSAGSGRDAGTRQQLTTTLWPVWY